MTDTKIPLAGVIGSPIAHSKSPVLHRHWLQTYGVAGFYVPMDVASADLERVLRTMPQMGLSASTSRSPTKKRYWVSPI